MNAMFHPSRIVPQALVLLAILASLLACGGDGAGDSAGDEAVLPEIPEAAGAVSSIRVVSLAPALTQMIVDMKQQHLLVGVAENDMAAPLGEDQKPLPTVGNFQAINDEALLALRPTHVLTMAGPDGPPPELKELTQRQKIALVVFDMADSIDQVGQILFHEPLELGDVHRIDMGDALDAINQARESKYRMFGELNRLIQVTEKVTQRATRPRVLMVIDTPKIMASGPKTVNDHLLYYAGGSNAADDASVGAPVYTREQLVQLRPDVILIFEPNGLPLGPVDSDLRLAELRGLDIPAVRENRVHLINDPRAMLPSTSLPRVGAQMARLIHPSLATEIDAAMSQDPLAIPATQSATQPATAPATLPAEAGDSTTPTIAPQPVPTH